MKILSMVIALIAIIILVLLLAPRQIQGDTYSVRDRGSRARATNTRRSNNLHIIASHNTWGTRFKVHGFEIERRVPPGTATSYVSYTYPSYQYQQSTQYYPDGCDAMTMYSATTGQLCR